jgi:uncharacterized protein (DUF305 family)
MQKNTTITLVVVLVLGLGIGYMFGTKNVPAPTVNQTASSTHVMPDGQVMQSDGMTMTDMMASMNAELKGKTGDAFDQAFLSEMIVHHQGAVEMAQLALTNAKHTEIKNLAVAIVSAQNKEIADMKSWLSSWYNQN